MHFSSGGPGSRSDQVRLVSSFARNSKQNSRPDGNESPCEEFPRLIGSVAGRAYKRCAESHRNLLRTHTLQFALGLTAILSHHASVLISFVACLSKRARATTPKQRNIRLWWTSLYRHLISVLSASSQRWLWRTVW